MDGGISPPTAGRKMTNHDKFFVKNNENLAFHLVPSQVPKSLPLRDNTFHPSSILSDIYFARSRTRIRVDEDVDGGDRIVYKPPVQIRRETTTTVNGTWKNPNKRKKMVMLGNIPDVHWRAIPMEHLRQHPNFSPLPPPHTITHLNTLEDVRNFRQGSWQWDALHTGRCTTSQAAAALGLLEPEAASELGIPKSLRRGGLKAFVKLRKDVGVLRTLEEMERVLCCGNEEWRECEDEEEEQCNPDINYKDFWNESETLDETNQPVWEHVRRARDRRTRRKPYPFAARYLPKVSHRDLERRRKVAARDLHTAYDASPFMARMYWGNAQEATAILTCLNHFWKQNQDIVIKETGMCGAGLDLTAEEDGDCDSKLILGATPDAIIQHPNGTIEALEVKNHCPFVPIFSDSKRGTWQNYRGRSLQDEIGEDNNRNNTSIPNHSNTHHYHQEQQSNYTFRIREIPLQSTIPASYIPQLMLEILCLGEKCRSAIMVRQTATKGAAIYRVRRDDQWIKEMLYWLKRFMKDFVNQDEPPPQNFFYENEDEENGRRYRLFIQRTKELSNSVELIEHVNHGSIQRVISEKFGWLPLFLDKF